MNDVCFVKSSTSLGDKRLHASFPMVTLSLESRKFRDSERFVKSISSRVMKFIKQIKKENN